MAKVDGGESGPQGEANQTARRLIRRAQLWEVLTFAVVVLVSPISFVLGLPFGITPDTWFAFWKHWTVVFIILAFAIGLLGFDAALTCRFKAEGSRT
jgi:membrane protein YdbS with pleckstrin-like domain